mgnify:CR=1 FL=1
MPPARAPEVAAVARAYSHRMMRYQGSQRLRTASHHPPITGVPLDSEGRPGTVRRSERIRRGPVEDEPEGGRWHPPRRSTRSSHSTAENPFQVGSIRWGVGKVCVQGTRPDYCTSSLAAQVTEVVCTAGFGPERRVPEPQLHSALARNLLGFADRNPGPVPQRCSRPRYFPKPSAPWEMQRRGSWAAERGCKHRVLARTLGGAEALRPDAAAGWVVQPGTHARRAARIRQPGGRATGHLYGWVRARCPGRALTGSHPSQAPIRHPPHPTSRLQ